MTADKKINLNRGKVVIKPSTKSPSPDYKGVTERLRTTVTNFSWSKVTIEVEKLGDNHLLFIIKTPENDMNAFISVVLK